MSATTHLTSYTDERGNEIIFTGNIERNTKITFRGSHNKLIVSADVRVALLNIDFDCDNGRFELGGSRGGGIIKAHCRVGQDASIVIGPNVTMTNGAYFSAVEGVSVVVGRDVMFASGVQVRADDAHPIFDVRTEKRVNPAKNIRIGDHVWLGNNVSLLGGADVGNGSVIGLGSVVTKRIPNNCVAVGSPARVTRRDVAWERPHLSLAKPFYKPDASAVEKSGYWALTEMDESVPALPPVGGLVGRFRRALAAFTA